MNSKELRRQYELLVGKYQFVDEQRHGLIKELEQAEKRNAELEKENRILRLRLTSEPLKSTEEAVEEACGGKVSDGKTSE